MHPQLGPAPLTAPPHSSPTQYPTHSSLQLPPQPRYTIAMRADAGRGCGALGPLLRPGNAGVTPSWPRNCCGRCSCSEEEREVNNICLWLLGLLSHSLGKDTARGDGLTSELLGGRLGYTHSIEWREGTSLFWMMLHGLAKSLEEWERCAGLATFLTKVASIHRRLAST